MNMKWIWNMANCVNMNTDYRVKLIGEMEGWLGGGIDLVENVGSNYPSTI